MIVPGGGSSNRPALDAILGPLNAKLQALYEVQRSATAVGLVAEGLGAAIVPELSIQPGAYPQLRLVQLNTPVVERTFVLLRRKGSAIHPEKQIFQQDQGSSRFKNYGVFTRFKSSGRCRTSCFHSC